MALCTPPPHTHTVREKGWAEVKGEEPNLSSRADGLLTVPKSIF